MTAIPESVATTPLSEQLKDLNHFSQGKVRDIYELGKNLLIVTTDRISTFDWVHPTLIPDKGRILSTISDFWFEHLETPNHVVSDDVDVIEGLPSSLDIELLRGRVMLVKRCKVVPIECIVRGYITGSGWKEYQQNGTVCSITLPANLQESAKLSAAIFTPSTKAEQGHDENISFTKMVSSLGGNQELARELRRRSLDLYSRAHEYALQKGIIIADTKFEWGWDGDELILIDEVLTPDSSRFWPADQYEPGRSQPSFDKQFVRDWLTSETDWDKNSPAPELPDDVVTSTRTKYIEAYERLLEQQFPWK